MNVDFTPEVTLTTLAKGMAAVVVGVALLTEQTPQRQLDGRGSAKTPANIA